MGPYAFKGFADMGNSFLKSYQSELDRKEQQKRYEQDQAWREEQRGRQRQEWQKSDAFDKVIQEEYAPVTAERQYGAGDEGPTMAMDVRGQRFTDQGQADAAVTAANSPMQRANRAADRGMAIDPTRATKLRNDAMTSRAAELGLSKAERDELYETFNTNVVGMLNAAPTWWEGAAKSAELVLGGQGQAVPELSPDGKKVSMFYVTPDGDRQLQWTESTDARGKDAYLAKALKMPAAVQVKYLQELANREREFEERQQARTEKREDFDYELGARQKSAISTYNATTGARPREGAPGQLVTVAGPDGQPTYARVVGDKLVPVDMGGMALPDRTKGVEQEWQDIEKQLFKDQIPPADIRLNKIAFMESRGIAPPEVVAVVATGVNPKTRKPFSEQEIAALQARYPNTRLPAPRAAAPSPATAMPPPAASAPRQRTYGPGIVPPRTAADLKPAPPPVSDDQFLIDLGRRMQR
jgi:hypothetical protein